MSPLTDFFTDLDPGISGSVQSDPMGLEVIWTGFAYNLFESRINSITNDFRSYTINLFHHWIIYRVRAKRDPKWWKPTSRNRFQGGDKAAFSRALLVLLEKILLLAFCKTGLSFDDQGLTGLNNARNVYVRAGRAYRYSLDDTPNKDTDILARHAQLGFSGRYRTAFTSKLLLLEKATGHPVENADRWERIQKLFCRFSEFRDLGDALEATLVKVLEHGQDEFTAASLEVGLEDLYVKAFGSRARLEKKFAKFWQDELALHEGTTRWLWESLSRAQPSSELSPQKLYQNALEIGERAGDVQGTQGIRRICEVEPYLARASRIFDGLLLIENHTYQQAVEWVVSRYGNYPLLEVAPPDPQDLVSALDGVGKERLAILLPLHDLAGSKLVLKLLEYHKFVSDYRRSIPWVQEEGGFWRQRRLLPAPTDKESEASQEPWLHPYYGWPFVNLAQAIRRGASL